MRWITILNLIPSKDGTNLRFQIPCGGGKDFVKGQNFSSFLLDSDWVLRGLV